MEPGKMICLNLIAVLLFSGWFTVAADSGWTKWGPFNECSKTCGCGWKLRTRVCNNVPEALGGPGCNGSSSELEKCNDMPCPEFGEWVPYGECTCSCGGGVQVQTRPCNRVPQAFGGPGCTTGEPSRTRECNTEPCTENPAKPVNGGWSAFEAWGACSKTCGGGSQERSRSCTNPTPAHGGKDCIGESKENQACGSAACPVNGGWSEFSTWSKCTKTCGGGSQERSRSCTNPPPAHGGKDCIGQSKEDQACGTKTCPECISKTYTKDRKCCQFPFIYKKKARTKCVTPTNGNLPWCGTTFNYDYEKQWGRCNGDEQGLLYLMGKNKENCTSACARHNRTCAATGHGFDKLDVSRIFESLGKNCGTSTIPRYTNIDNPDFRTSGGLDSQCIGFYSVPAKINCGAGYNVHAQRLCPCLKA